MTLPRSKRELLYQLIIAEALARPGEGPLARRPFVSYCARALARQPAREQAQEARPRRERGAE